MQNLKKENGTNELIYKRETDSQTEDKHGYQRGKAGKELTGSLGVNIYILLHLKLITY